MQIPLQEKIAELERRIQALEAQRSASTTTHTTTVTNGPLTPTQQGHLDRMWGLLDNVFVEMGKVFR